MKFILGAMLGVAIGWWLHAWQFTALPAPVTAPTSVVVPEAVPLATDPAPSADTLFALLLSSGATDQALEFLAKAPQPEPFRQRLLMHIQSLLDSKQLDRADELLDRYLRREFRDVDALLLQATLFKAQGKIQAALTALFRLRSYEYRSAQLAENQRRIDRWVDEYQVQLRQQPAATQLQFWQFLAAQDAQRLDYVVQMAALSIDLGHESQARQYLQLLAADGQFDSQRRELLRQLEFRRLARNDVVINLQRQGGHFLLPVTLDGRTEASLLIDTGATMTV
ncbi:MAG: hypothetical protein OEW58_10375, partial [Gammaproteobacteria bacterium]|nr:hypothetical protein [Gammaproteobacteria bacterium]